MSSVHFSTTYDEARLRFLRAVRSAGGQSQPYVLEIEHQDELAIDVASIGDESHPTVVLSSGVHGVEGFFGSAVQLAFLEQLRQEQRTGIRFLLIHAVNPFGFATLRRFNENNIDLNRNFLNDKSEYRGTPDGYSELDALLNPPTPPSRLEPFRLKAIWNIWRHGLQAIKQSVAGGQYEYPRGIFFGGKSPSQTARIVSDNCGEWLGSTSAIVHIDFHTGLGPFGSYKLLLSELADSSICSWYRDTFGADVVEPFAAQGTAYKASGMFGSWMHDHFGPEKYRFVCAEFGTYDVIRVVAAIRAENRAFHYGSKQSQAYRSAKQELFECFCPRDVNWRKQTVTSGLTIIQQAVDALRAQTNSQT